MKQGCILSPILFNIFLSDLQQELEQKYCNPVNISSSVESGCLIWADDLLLMSKTEIGLQNMLNALKNDTSKNGMTLNIGKTKVMIFNKSGRHMRRQFYFGENKIEIARQYKYLGFMMTPSGEITTGLKDLKDRASRALMSMKYKLGPLFKNKPLISIKLFNSLVKPILLYASDFWGILKLPQNNPIENLHLSFCKQLLGVQKQTTNIGVLLELGQVPLTIDAIKNAIKNWVRIASHNKCNEMIIKSHENAILLHLNWSTRIKNTLEEIGMYDAYLEQNRNAHITIFQRLIDTFHQNAFSEIGRESSKLRTYHIIKTKIGYEDYLNEIQNIEARVAFTKFRLSNHSLMIEIGRHQRIDKSLRHCPFCPSEIEDELHFLIECKTYRSHRKELRRDEPKSIETLHI